MYRNQLLKTQRELLNAVETAEIPQNFKNILNRILRRIDMERIFQAHRQNGYEADGMQDLIIKHIKENAPFSDEDFEYAVKDIVYSVLQPQ